MTLHITIVPASSQGGKETIRNLLNHASRPSVRGIYRDTAKAPAEFTTNPDFEAVQGDVSRSSPDHLQIISRSSPDFTGSDAVLYVPPPTYEEVNVAEFATNAANNVKAGLERASVKRVLLFSAMGSQHDPDAISAPEVLVIKPGWFHENWAEAFATVKKDPAYFESIFTPVNYETPMVSIVDVGRVCAQKLLQAGQALPSSPYVFELFGPRHYSALDVGRALEKATGKSVEVVPVKPEGLGEHSGKHLPASHVQSYVNMITATLEGGCHGWGLPRG
ncbi:hypothetical protein ACHAQH_006884 [Verticillium albo-atrum]